MKKLLVAAALGLFATTPATASIISKCKFDTATLTFMGSPIEQARCLIQPVNIRGDLGPLPTKLGDVLETRIGKSVAIDRAKLESLLRSEGVADWIATLDRPVAKTSGGLSALYFVIHDTSQKYPGTSFPANGDAALNRLGFKYANGDWIAHAFVDRLGRSLIAMDLSVPWRATQLEKAAGASSKGRFLHVENNQPRLDNPDNGISDDQLAPSPGLTSPQLRRLALLYVVASYRAKKWMIPGFHGVIDNGVGDHDDPQNFDRAAFESVLADLIQQVETSGAVVAASFATTLRATIYYAALEGDYPGRDSAFLAMNGSELAKASRTFVDKAAIEGSAKLTDGRALNYAGKVGGRVRWKWTALAYGEDAIGCGLVPFRTIAVDRNAIPLHTKVFLPETVGMILPGGRVHDGMWYAADTGSAITADRVDLFVGAGKAAMNIVYGSGIGHLQPLRYEKRGTFAGCPPTL